MGLLWGHRQRELKGMPLSRQSRAPKKRSPGTLCDLPRGQGHLGIGLGVGVLMALTGGERGVLK